MSKYHPLSERLSAHPELEWGVSFSELESVLGFPLPKAARTSRGWWTNDLDKGHSRAWAAHGWEVGDIDHAAERVVFRKGAASGVALVQAAHLEPLGEGAGLEPHPEPPPPAEQPAPVQVAPPEPPSAPPSQTNRSSDVQPAAMLEAAEAASAQMHGRRKLGGTAILAGAAGLSALVIRRLLWRKRR